MSAANRLIGTGRMVVVLCSPEISFIVCKKRSWRAIGCAEKHRCHLHEFLRRLKPGLRRL